MPFVATGMDLGDIKLSEILPFVATGMDLGDINLSEIYQAEKDKEIRRISLICGILENKTN